MTKFVGGPFLSSGGGGIPGFCMSLCTGCYPIPLHTSGPQAEKEFKAAQEMIKSIINQKLLQANGVLGIFRANSVGDDIEVYSDNGTKIDTLFGLRQQVRLSHDCHVIVSQSALSSIIALDLTHYMPSVMHVIFRK